MNAKIKRIFQPYALPIAPSIALLLLRLVFGTAFLFYGSMKITNPFHWMGPDAHVPGFFQLLAAISEFGGGLALILGLLTPLAMAGLSFTMLVATAMMALAMHAPFVDLKGSPMSFDRPLIFLCIALVYMLLGPGKFSADALIFKEKQ